VRVDESIFDSDGDIWFFNFLKKFEKSVFLAVVIEPLVEEI